MKNVFSRSVADAGTRRMPADIAAAGISLPSASNTAISDSASAAIFGTATLDALAAAFTRSTRSFPDARLGEMCGPPYGHPLPSVRSMRSPSDFAVSAAKCSELRCSGDRNPKFFTSAPSSTSGYVACTSNPPMPASFITRISRSSSRFSIAGPNHHQRIMMRASSGGFSNCDCRRSRVCADTPTAHRRTRTGTSRRIRPILLLWILKYDLRFARVLVIIPEIDDVARADNAAALATDRLGARREQVALRPQVYEVVVDGGLNHVDGEVHRMRFHFDAHHARGIGIDPHRAGIGGQHLRRVHRDFPGGMRLGHRKIVDRRGHARSHGFADPSEIRVRRRMEEVQQDRAELAARRITADLIHLLFFGQPA